MIVVQIAWQLPNGSLAVFPPDPAGFDHEIQTHHQFSSLFAPPGLLIFYQEIFSILSPSVHQPRKVPNCNHDFQLIVIANALFLEWFNNDAA